MSAMTYQESYNYLNSTAYAPVFFNKLATAYGLTPADEQEARRWIDLAPKLKAAEQAEAVKTAGQRATVIDEAHRDIDELLNKRYGINPSANYGLEANIKQAASELANDEAFRNAALVYGDFLQQVANQKQ